MHCVQSCIAFLLIMVISLAANGCTKVDNTGPVLGNRACFDMTLKQFHMCNYQTLFSKCCNLCSENRLELESCFEKIYPGVCTDLNDEDCYNIETELFCCASCHDRARNRETNIKGCLYGDKDPSFCTEIDAFQCHQYSNKCCETCYGSSDQLFTDYLNGNRRPNFCSILSIHCDNEDIYGDCCALCNENAAKPIEDTQSFTCDYFCFDENTTELLAPPKFQQPCIPEDIRLSYFTKQGSSHIDVKWTEPVATDRNRAPARVEQVKGQTNGNSFLGSVTGRRHNIVYLATDNDGLTDYCFFNFIVFVPSCPNIQGLQNGRYTCTNGNAPGSSCFFSCDKGFRLSGSGNATCGFTSSTSNIPVWNDISRCEKIKCSLPIRPDNARYLCSDENHTFQSVCHIHCEEGFAPVGPIYIMCQDNGKWSKPTACIRYQYGNTQCSLSLCNGHTCRYTLDNTSTCKCSHGWSGTTCNIPPNHCAENICMYSTTCYSQHTEQSSYNCSCGYGYSGSLCQITPVDGGWSDWSIWEDCSVMCGHGVRTRHRSCNNPYPDTYGKFCEGPYTEISPCEVGKCDVCPEFYHVNGTLSYLECETHDTGLQTCQLHCKNDTIPSPWFDKFETLRCGKETNYIWVPASLQASCVVPVVPKELRLDCNITYQMNIPLYDYNVVETQVLGNIKDTKCKQSSNCDATLTLSSTKEEGDSQTILNIVFRTNFDQITTHVSNAVLKEVQSAIDALESTSDFLKNFTAKTFDINNKYLANEKTLEFQGHVSCSEGKVPANGICVECPPGSFRRESQCVFCQKGTYQEQSGQTTCIPCPHGHTTQTVATIYSLHCYVPKQDEDKGELTQESNILTILGPVLGVVVALPAFVACFYQIREKQCRKKGQRETEDKYQDMPARPIRSETDSYLHRYGSNAQEPIFHLPARHVPDFRYTNYYDRRLFSHREPEREMRDLQHDSRRFRQQEMENRYGRPFYNYM